MIKLITIMGLMLTSLTALSAFAAECGDPGVKCVAAPEIEDISNLSSECSVVKGFLLTRTLLSHSSGTFSDLVQDNELEMTKDSWDRISERINQRANLLADSILHLRDYVKSTDLKEAILSAGLSLRDALRDASNAHSKIVVAETESTQSLLSLKRAYEKTCN